MTPEDFRAHIARLGYSQAGFARHVGKNERTVRRWAKGEIDVPGWVELMLTGKLPKP